MKRRRTMRRAMVAGVIAVCACAGLTQTPAPPEAQPAVEAQSGGRLHGMVKSGAIPLPGVTVTAQNTLTGKRFSTTTDINGTWSLTIPQNGRYVLRTQFAGFAPEAHEALLNASSHDQTVGFDLMLASRAATQQANAKAIRQLITNGAQNLNLTSTLAGETESQADPSGAAGAALPSIAGNSDFSGDSVAISGQAGAVSPLAGLDMDRVRDAIESARAQGMIPDGAMSGGNFGGFGGRGVYGGGRGNFRGFNPGQPHGAVFWIGSNSSLNAEPFNIGGGSQQQQPPSGSNRFGITFMSAPYLPGLLKPSGKDTIFMTLSGTRTSSPLTQFANVPTDGSFPGTYDERAGDFTGQPTLYDPVRGTPYLNNQIPVSLVSAALLKYFPAPNLPGYSRNYELLATQQSNSTQAGVRYMRSLGANAAQPGGSHGGFGSGRRSQQNQGLRQSINFNYNWSGTAQDNVNVFPQLGGKSATNANSLQAGYTVGYH
ncbi:MAG TPA: carboxypeptidase-like regulatory domain-containing protein, partial [Terracidiphilus sp.]